MTTITGLLSHTASFLPEYEHMPPPIFHFLFYESFGDERISEESFPVMWLCDHGAVIVCLIEAFYRKSVILWWLCASLYIYFPPFYFVQFWVLAPPPSLVEAAWPHPWNHSLCLRSWNCGRLFSWWFVKMRRYCCKYAKWSCVIVLPAFVNWFSQIYKLNFVKCRFQRCVDIRFFLTGKELRNP